MLKKIGPWVTLVALIFCVIAKLWILVGINFVVLLFWLFCWVKEASHDLDEW